LLSLGFGDEVVVIKSLQAPRRITIKGSDGKDYFFLCKPKDDLRKDARIMNVNNVINHLLAKDPEARKRRLHIRSYAVLPLSSDCGLVEWVNDTKVYDQIIGDMYRGRSISLPVSSVLFARTICLVGFVTDVPR
jgi:serine/threonine-protein kinase ATR